MIQNVITVGQYDVSREEQNIMNAGTKVLSHLCTDRVYTQKNTDVLTKKFGKHTGSFRGEFNYKIRALQYKGETFWVYSSNRGTEFSIVDVVYEQMESKAGVIIEFLKAWLEEIRKD